MCFWLVTSHGCEAMILLSPPSGRYRVLTLKNTNVFDLSLSKLNVVDVVMCDGMDVGGVTEIGKGVLTYERCVSRPHSFPSALW
jgi:hypothetical protein